MIHILQGGSGESALSLWEDEDTRTFYENLVDLKSVVPGVSASGSYAYHYEKDIAFLNSHSWMCDS